MCFSLRTKEKEQAGYFHFFGGLDEMEQRTVYCMCPIPGLFPMCYSLLCQDNLKQHLARQERSLKGSREGGVGRQEADDGVSPHHLFSLKSLFLAQFHILSVFLLSFGSLLACRIFFLFNNRDRFQLIITACVREVK